MGALSLVLVLLEREKAEDTAEIGLGYGGTIDVFVGNLCKGSHSILSRVHVLSREGIRLHSDALDHSDGRGDEWLESLLGESMSESTKTVGDSMLDHAIFSVFIIGSNLNEFLSELSDSRHVILETGVIDKVAPEAHNIKDLFGSQSGVILKLSSPVVLAVLGNNSEGLIIEFLDKLTRELHDLAGDSANFSEFFSQSLEILIIDIVGRLGLLNDSLVSGL